MLKNSSSNGNLIKVLGIVITVLCMFFAALAGAWLSGDSIHKEVDAVELTVTKHEYLIENTRTNISEIKGSMEKLETAQTDIKEALIRIESRLPE